MNESVYFSSKIPLLLDGATGTNLLAAGMPHGVCVEQWICENPEPLQTLQKRYKAAGSSIISAPTFGANRMKLEDYGLGEKTAELNRRLVEITREAVGAEVLVAGDVSPTGRFIEPFGDTTFDELYECYKEQIRAQREAGADLIFCETMLSLAEARAAVIAANEEDIPVFVSFTVDEHGRTLTGAQLLPCLITLQAMGAAAVGLNCSGGPEEIAEFIEEAKPYADIPLIAKPNAGKPLNEAGTEYELSAERFAPYLYPLLKAGARYIGGCCGTTPVHIKLLKSALDKAVIPALPESEDVLAAASETQAFFLSDHMEMSDPIECGYDLADDLIDLEDERVNVARVRVSSAEDAEELARNAHMSHLPIAILPQNAECLERALRLYQGRAIIDSGCGLPPGELLPAAQKYGAIII